VVGFRPRWFTCPQAVAHPSSNRARRRAMSLIQTNALTTTVHQAAIIPLSNDYSLTHLTQFPPLYTTTDQSLSYNKLSVVHSNILDLLIISRFWLLQLTQHHCSHMAKLSVAMSNQLCILQSRSLHRHAMSIKHILLTKDYLLKVENSNSTFSESLKAS